MGRRLLACTPFLSAMLVGCLVRPSPSGQRMADAGGRDGGADGMHADGSPPPVCMGEGAPVDPLTSGMCGTGMGSSFGGTLMAEGGMLSVMVDMGNASCTWNIINNDSSFQGVVVHVARAPDTMGEANLTFSDNNGIYSLGFQNGSDVDVTGGSWNPEQPVEVSGAFCARIHYVPAVGSGASMLEGQVDTGTGWQTVATGYWYPMQTTQVELGAFGMGGTATFDHFDYVAP